MTIFGLLGFTHGWARVLTVLSPQGSAQILEVVQAGEDVVVKAEPGRPIQYVERRSAGLADLVARHGIIVLTKDQWDAKKAEVGEAAWR